MLKGQLEIKVKIWLKTCVQWFLSLSYYTVKYEISQKYLECTNRNDNMLSLTFCGYFVITKYEHDDVEIYFSLK